MLGFLGTVKGMVEAFYNLASAGSSANTTSLQEVSMRLSSPLSPV